MEEAEGYDMVNTMFTPDGRLRQVEYATKTSKRGSPVISLICKDGVLIIDHRRIFSNLRETRVQQKIEEIDDHISVGISGIISDGVAVIEGAQLDASSHKMTFGTPVDVKSVVYEVSQVFQSYTQFSGLRPFGISLIVAGIDQSGPSVYLVEPFGTFYGYYAICIGENEEEIKEELRKQTWVDMTREEAISGCISIFKKILDKKYKVELIQGKFMRNDGKSFEALDLKEIKKLAKSK